MITLTIYVALIVIAIVLAVYSLWDSQNRVYGNIIACFLSSLLFYFTGIAGINGEVVDIQVLQNGTYESVTTNATTNLSISAIQYTYTEVVTPLYYAPVGWILVMLGTIALIVTAMFVLNEVLKTLPKDRW